MNTFDGARGFHDRVLLNKWQAATGGHWETKFHYKFANFFHPFVGEFLSKLSRGSLPALMDAAWQSQLKQDFFDQFYEVPQDRLVEVASFPKEVEFAAQGAYSTYNWELFFHIPFTIAVHLSKSQRFAEAQRWFHYIFDPTSTDEEDPPKRFWKFLAFRNDETPAGIDELLVLLSEPSEGLSEKDRVIRKGILDGYRAILDKPFQPHAVARTRIVAYQYAIVMKYLDNLIAWGDQLFQQDTLESINEATQLYALCSNLLGPRPERIPPIGAPQPKTFAQLKAAGLSEVGDALVELESQFPFNLDATGPSASNGDGAAALFGIGRALYFCVPRNDKLLGYWDTVGDRLFKIRHCMNIQGVVRSLALFDPPLDPGMLVKAAAAGIDINSIVSGLNQPIGPVRSLVLIQKALELCAEVRALGNAVLAAFERGDAEHLTLIRQGQEVRIQRMTQDVRFLQWKNTEEATNSLVTSRNATLERLRYYQRLLGLPDDPDAKELTANELTRGELTEDNFDDAYHRLVGQYDTTANALAFPALKVLGGPGADSGASGKGLLYLNRTEDKELNSHLRNAKDARLGASVAEATATAFFPVPDVNANAHFWGIGATVCLPTGTSLAAAAKSGAALLQLLSAYEQDQAGMASRTAGYERRADEWLLQYNLAAHELKQNGRQILTSLIAEQIAHHEYDTLKQQIEDSQQVSQFLQDKFTNEDLSLWMQGETSRLYYAYYRFAFDTARKAEATMKQELLRPELDAQDFVKFNYWDAGRKGLLAGDALHLDVKRMEMAYHDHNKREFELTRHVSLRQLKPLALLALRGPKARCEFSVPEWLYDKDCPGHYLRRIESVSVSIPSVVGPYSGVNCTLTLLSSSIRKSPALSESQYIRHGSEDDRFIDYTGAVQSIVTSSAIGDSGMFETNLHDERFLPFEGAGAISSWRLELPQKYRAFDYASISDVVLHIRYTARPGIAVETVTKSLTDLFAGDSDEPATLTLLLSMAHDFPTQWAAFVNGNSDFAATVRREHFPYFAQGRTISITTLEVYDANATGHGFGDAEAASAALGTTGAFAVALPEDTSSQQVVVRQAGIETFLVISYTLTNV